MKPLKLPKMHRNNVMNPIVFSPLSPILTDRHLSLSLSHTHTHTTQHKDFTNHCEALQHAMHLHLILAVVVLTIALPSLGDTSRDAAFIGYSEQRSLRIVSTKSTTEASLSKPLAIRVLLEPRHCPLTSSMLHAAIGNGGAQAGSWYRNEAVPSLEEGSGPPYGLLQGKMTGINFPKEENNVRSIYIYIYIAIYICIFTDLDHSAGRSRERERESVCVCVGELR